MCGVFAYMNYNVPRERRYILEVLFNGLKRLEHRGYDSAGIAIDGDLSSALPLVFRQEGKIELLVRHAYSEVDAMGLDLEKSFMVHAGIAHTRWATHGVPSLRNSHPQSSGLRNEFLVVHNGIITNYEVLKETLIRHGFTFESDTDTEVIPKLAKFIFDQAHKGDHAITFSQVIIEVMRQIEGAYALIFKSSHYPNELIACRRGSTLILGVKSLTDEKNHTTSFGDVKSLRTDGQPKELFFSSDLCAIVEHTKNYLDIEDNEVVHLKVKEITRIHSEGIYASELKHGPLALVDETLPILVIATRDDYFSLQQSLIEQLHARKGDLIVMCSKGDAASVSCGDSCRLIEVPLVEDCLQPVINIIPLQLLAYHITVLRGYDVDQPRNLAKSVTTR